jgi:hypothetical protein
MAETSNSREINLFIVRLLLLVFLGDRCADSIVDAMVCTFPWFGTTPPFPFTFLSEGIRTQAVSFCNERAC